MNALNVVSSGHILAFRDSTAYKVCSWIAVTGFCVLSIGCRSEISRSKLQESQLLADQAVELERIGNFSDAWTMIDQAIKVGGLNPDQLAEAYLLRARCSCASDKVVEAEADLEQAERGSPNPVSWHFTRAILLAKQGKEADSKAEFNKARKIDPSLRMP